MKFKADKSENKALGIVIISGELYPLDAPENRVTFEETLDAGVVSTARFRAFRGEEVGRLFFTLQNETRAPDFAFPTITLACLASRQFLRPRTMQLDPCFPS